MVRLVLVLCALGLTGCLAAYGQMTPEQLGEVAKIKDAHAGCIIVNTPYGRGVTVWGNADKGVLGKLTISGDCLLTIEGPVK